MSQVFLNIPKTVYADEDYDVKPPRYGTVDQLMASIKESGPLVAVGKLGPAAYNKEPFKLKSSMNGNEVWGWRSGAAKTYAAYQNVFIVGVKKEENKGYVYYVPAIDLTESKTSLIRKYVPASSEKKVYVMSYKNFLERALFNLHPVCPHGQYLFSELKVETMEKNEEVRMECKQKGQEIFDHYKEKAGGSSTSGKEGVQKICDAISLFAPNGALLKKLVERALSGIGDKTWTWIH